MRVSIFLASIVILLIALPASASTISYLDIEDSSIGTGTLGTVTLTPNGSDEVDVEVKLNPGVGFVQTGNHHSFAFNLDLVTPFTITVTSPLNAFSVLTTADNNPPFNANFSDEINCTSTGCGNGGSDPNAGPLDFKVVDPSGISTDDFVATKDGVFFSADLLGPAGGTGVVGSDEKISVSPLPPALPMFAAGLLALITLGYRRARKTAIALRR